MENEKGSIKKSGQAYNDRDQELIHELIKSRLEQKEELEYDPLDDYEVPPPVQFSNLSKPAVTIKYPHITFSTSSVRLFEGIEHILPLRSWGKRRFVAAPLAEEESSSLNWAREKDGKWISRTVVARGFLDEVFEVMGWEKRCRYKMWGRVTNSPLGLVLAFDLEDAMMFTGKKIETIDPVSGETKLKPDMFYPERYKNGVGIPLDEYMSGHQMTIFDDFDFPVVKTYSDLTEDYFEEWDKESKTAEEEATAASVDVQNVAALDAEIALEPDVSPPQESPPDTEEPLQTESDMTQANERENGGEVPDPGVFVVPDHGAAIDASDGGMKNGEG